MKSITKSCDAISSVFATLLLIILVVISGLTLYNFVMSKVEFMQNMFDTQMSTLILKSFTINSTHLISWIQNTGGRIIKITAAYVNGLIAAVQGLSEIEPYSIQPIVITASFIKGNTYTVKLQGLFGIVITFQVAY